MKITKVNIPAVQSTNGLGDIKMERLSDIVLIAGPNGGGKSRLLSSVIKGFTEKPVASAIDGAKRAIAQLKQQKVNLLKEHKLFEKNLLRPDIIPNDTLSIEQRIVNTNQNLQRVESAIESHEKTIAYNNIETAGAYDVHNMYYFVPKGELLKNPNDLSKNNVSQAAAHIDHIGVGNLPNGALAKILVTQDKWFNVTHPNSSATQEEKELATVKYEKLEELIQVFLGTKLGRDSDGTPTLFGFPIGMEHLSMGQIVLLQFCMAIFSQEVALKDLIIVMDEPENHLHPLALIEVIEKIRNCIQNGQIWIATHSVPLLAHFDSQLIWFVENGKVRHGGRIPEKVLQSLLGGEEELGKLQDFISLPAQMASCRFALESIYEPRVVETNAWDPQSLQIKADLLDLAVGTKLRVLDFGAGKGRLISNIHELEGIQQTNLVEKLDYIAFEPFPDPEDLCKQALAKAYGTADDRFFSSISDILSKFDQESFDVVIMCNVLHEVDPKDWLGLFGASGQICKLLSPKGILLLVEDHQLPIGEMAYQKGFLVMDTAQLKVLFKIRESDGDMQFSDQRGDGRLKAHRISRDFLKRMDAISRVEAIKMVAEHSQQKIKQVRMSEKNYKNGKLHGFYTQQFANAALNISELEG